MKPNLPNELAVSYQTVDVAGPEKADKPLQKSPALLPIGITALGKKAEYQGQRNPLIGYLSSTK